MAIAIASTTMTACSSDDNETEKPFTTDPVESSMLYACGVGQSETRSVADAQNVLFTENDIEWFNVTTREIKFKDMDEPLYRRMQPFHEITSVCSPSTKSSSIWATMPCLWSAVSSVTGIVGFSPTLSCIMM